MPPPIVYEGVNGSYEGTLFNGLKFFVSKRLPLRREVVEKIKNNGGKTVELEKFADLLIWDHLITHGAPSGAVSAKFIEDCISKGEIANKDEYLVATSARPVGSSVSTRKGTKYPFTPKDDQTLLSWIRQKEEAGVSIKGNTIYQELAVKYPHHTYQSWRSRYIDKLSHLPQQSVRPLPPPTPTPVKSRSSINARAAPSSTAPTPSSSTTPKGFSRRVPYTAEDDRILLQHLDEHGGARSGTKIYKELEEKYPHHTWQSWRERYVKTLSKRKNFDPGETAEPIQVTRPRQQPSGSELPPAKRLRTSISSSSNVQSTALMAPPSTQLVMTEEDKIRFEALKEKKRKMMEAKASTRANISGQANVSRRAVSSSLVEEPGNESRSANAVSSTPLALGNREDEVRRQELKQKMEQIRAERARKVSSTPASTPQGQSSRRTSTISYCEPQPQPQLQPQVKRKRKEPPTPTPATNQTPGFQTQAPPPSVETPQFRALHERAAARNAAQSKQLEQARARSRKSMAGLITSRESWLGLRYVFHEFNHLPEPSETLTVFGREVDCWDLWSGIVREGYPPSPDAWVRITEGLGYVDDQDLLEEGQRSVVQALKEAFEKYLVEFWLATEWFADVKFEPVEPQDGEGEE